MNKKIAHVMSNKILAKIIIRLYKSYIFALPPLISLHTPSLPLNTLHLLLVMFTAKTKFSGKKLDDFHDYV